MRRQVSTKARGTRGARWARIARLSGDSIIARETRKTRISSGARGSLWNLRIGEWTVRMRADRAALSVWDVGVFTIGCVLADHLVAEDGPHVTHTDLAGFWFPYILVIVRLSF